MAKRQRSLKGACDLGHLGGFGKTRVLELAAAVDRSWPSPPPGRGSAQGSGPRAKDWCAKGLSSVLLAVGGLVGAAPAVARSDGTTPLFGSSRIGRGSAEIFDLWAPRRVVRSGGMAVGRRAAGLSRSAGGAQRKGRFAGTLLGPRRQQCAFFSSTLGADPAPGLGPLRRELGTAAKGLASPVRSAGVVGGKLC